MDSVVGVINSLANIMYNCAALVPYLKTPQPDICTKKFVNGSVLNNVLSSLAFPGLTGQVQYGLNYIGNYSFPSSPFPTNQRSSRGFTLCLHSCFFSVSV